MVENDRAEATRRNVLRLTGGAAATAGVAGLASASPEETVEVNVGFVNDAGAAAFRRKADDVKRTFAFDAGTATMTAAAADALENNPNIRYVEENGTMHALGQCMPWGVDRVDADVAHANGYTGTGADVAILDTGIDSDHPDLQANLGKGKAFVSCDTSGGCRFGTEPADNTCNYAWDDDNDHGTHVAGTAGAVDNTEGVVGVGPDVTLHAVKVLDKCGSGTYSDIAAGLEYVADQGWDVANMSLGGSSGSSALKDAVQYAADMGVCLVAAAGNDGPCTNCVGYPAAYAEVIAVSAATKTDTLADFSSTGPAVDIIAPGKDVRSTIPGGYACFSGTSMAAPHVSGAIGVVLAAGGDCQTVLNTAEDTGLASNEQGNGLLDVAAALGLNSSDDLSGPNCGC